MSNDTKDSKIKSEVGRDLGLPTIEIIESLLHVLSYTRNVCAHHNRLRNRLFMKKVPYMEFLKNDMHLGQGSKEHQADNRVYSVLIVLLYLLNQKDLGSDFPERLIKLINSVSDENLKAMGFPNDWQKREIWKPFINSPSIELTASGL